MARHPNFNPGPSALPTPVLERAQAELLDYRGTGISILESSHRAPEFSAVIESAEERLRRVASLPDSHCVLWMVGGASLQFSLLPLNFLDQGQVASYVDTGTWSTKAITEARRFGRVHVAATSADTGFDRVPPSSDWDIEDGSRYAYVTSNNTICGTQYAALPESVGVPLVVDVSSDFLSRPVDYGRIDLAFAGAQKNLGPAGVTIVIARKDWLAQARSDVPRLMSYQTFESAGSMANTPPVFAIYLSELVLEWLEDSGGVAEMERRNQSKADRIYGVLDRFEGVYRPKAAKDSRSRMNVTFGLATSEMEAEFLSAAEAASLRGLKGHRSVGGMRASLYNAVSEEWVEELAQFMEEFAGRVGAVGS